LRKYARNTAGIFAVVRAVFQGADARVVGGAAIPVDVRERVRARLERNGVEALHAELAHRDPYLPNAEAARPTRIARALEVVEATGRSLTDWHRDGLPPLLPQGNFARSF